MAAADAHLLEPAERDTPLHALERTLSRFSNDRKLLRNGGRIDEISPSHYRVRGISAAARLGDVVEHRSSAGPRSGEIVRIGPDDVLVAPYETNPDAGIGDPVFIRTSSGAAPHLSWRGRVINALGKPVDGKGPLVAGEEVSPGTPPPALARQRVETGFRTGVRVIDIFTPICFGQRLGIFAGSGVGKSTLLAMLAA